MKYKEAIKILKVTRPTVCRYVRDGIIRANRLTNGQLDYNEDDVYKTAGIETSRKCVIYARVSTNKQKSSLDNQIEQLQQYANANGYIVSNIYKDIASGLNFDRGEFQTLLMEVIEHKIKTVFITNKDRLSRISFNIWKELFEHFNCKIIVLNEVTNQSESEENEIFEDIISMIHCFAMKMYSKRRKNKLQLIKENLEIEQQ